jgi:hypothetical protein
VRWDPSDPQKLYSCQNKLIMRGLPGLLKHDWIGNFPRQLASERFNLGESFAIEDSG